MLNGKAIVVGPVDNCQYSLYTLSRIDGWIDEFGKPDIVHWNNGLHDSGHNPARCPIQIPIDMYRANIKFILDRLMTLTSKVIWATTTPVHPEKSFPDTKWAWHNEEIDKYNAVAIELMQSRGVAINDLHSLVLANVSEFLDEQDKLHLSETGQKACGRAVADCVLTLL